MHSEAFNRGCTRSLLRSCSSAFCKTGKNTALLAISILRRKHGHTDIELAQTARVVAHQASSQPRRQAESQHANRTPSHNTTAANSGCGNLLGHCDLGDEGVAAAMSKLTIRTLKGFGGRKVRRVRDPCNVDIPRIQRNGGSTVTVVEGRARYAGRLDRAQRTVATEICGETQSTPGDVKHRNECISSRA